MAFTDEIAWNAGFDNPLTPVKDLRTIADGDVLRFAGLLPGGHAHARSHPRALFLPGGR